LPADAGDGCIEVGELVVEGEHEVEGIAGQQRGYLAEPIAMEAANEPANPFFECAVAFTADRLRRDPPRQEYIWEYRIPRGSRIAGSLSAAGGTGKTSMLMGLGLARAQGKNFLGIKTRPGTTVFLSSEEKAEDYERKVKAWSLNDLSFDYEAVARNLLVIDVVGRGVKLATVERGRYQTNQQDVGRLAEVIRARAPGADLVVMETASRLGPDETNEGHAALVTACEELSGLVGATVLVVGHVSKAAARERTGDAPAGRAVIVRRRGSLTGHPPPVSVRLWATALDQPRAT